MKKILHQGFKSSKTLKTTIKEAMAFNGIYTGYFKLKKLTSTVFFLLDLVFAKYLATFR
jgi:hypothetical protein